ncbi:hypothetical protein A0H81_13050 [Grifola frondosa]|uniref:Uncharacterized protein n=1 Tax=Grifola frondosa TaxID=5627 RepID=A0A1C7LR85_GRIFR|nr:hypothetical protein A0H81_13050 [Grifola frondosa]
MDYGHQSPPQGDTTDSPELHNTTGRQTRVEEVEDEEPGGLPKRPWIEDFPLLAAEVFGQASTQFEDIHAEKHTAGEDQWAPFADREEWELAEWLMTTGISQEAIDSYLKLPITRKRSALSFHNKDAFLKKIDSLPQGPTWICEPFEVTGDLKDEKGQTQVENVELWRRDPVECIRELLGNPAFKDDLRYAPEKMYGDRRAMNGYMMRCGVVTWWEVQSALPGGATVAPVILSSDKTQLSRFSGDKQAWPVYLNLGNISKATRRQPSKHATILLGYIPVTKLQCFSTSTRSLQGYRLFHSCMRSILEPLVQAGRDGVEMVCADGAIRRVHPIVAAYIADHPEQCLVVGCQENHCPKCTAGPTSLGDPVYSTMRNPEDVLRIIAEAARGEKPAEFKSYGLRLIEPFWTDLPHCDIFACITPDLLHQLHKGVFKDHTVSWATECVAGGAAEVDRRFRALPTHPDLRHFKKGISLVSQWTGTEYKNMEKVFLGVLTGASDPAVLRAVRGVLDFIHYAHFEAHSDTSLARLGDALAAFHANKEVFVKHGVREHFNIPKIHSTQHYQASIRKLGTADGFNTEGSERLHID